MVEFKVSTSVLIENTCVTMLSKFLMRVMLENGLLTGKTALAHGSLIVITN
jgi:hypothetical protein